MKRIWNLLCLSALPLLLIRLWDVKSNIDARTGFFHDERWFRHVLILLTFIALVLYENICARRQADETFHPKNSVGVLLAGAMTSLCVFVASLLMLYSSYTTGGGISYLLMPRRALMEMGIISTHFQTEFWCSLVGLATVAWFAWLCIRFNKGGDVSIKPLFCLLPVIWYSFRAFNDFSLAPVNYHNTLVFSCFTADLLLALAWYNVAHHAALGYTRQSRVKASTFILAAILFTVSFKFPVLFIPYSHHTIFDKIFILSDTLSAISLYFIASQYWKGTASNE